MESGIPEFNPGDTISIDVTIEPGSKIVGIKAHYKQDDYGVSSSGHITIEKGQADLHEVNLNRSSNPIPGPYLEGSITLDYTIPTDQPEGIYRLYYLEYVTALRTGLETQDVPESAIRIAKETLSAPSISSWSVSR